MVKAENFVQMNQAQNGGRLPVSYALLVKLADPLVALVQLEQEYAIGRYGEKDFPGVMPEMVIARFSAMEDMEDTLLRWLHRIVGQQEAFSVVFNNYGSMPGSPLYLRLQDPGPFREISTGLKSLDAVLKSNGAASVQVFHHPRLLITKKISEQQHMEILLDFSGRIFHEEMAVEEILLVKTGAGEMVARVVSRLMLVPKGLKRSG
jgi:hypothetical protein